MIIPLKNKTRLGKTTINWIGQPGMYYSMCKTNMGCVKAHLCYTTLTVIDDLYEIWDTKLGMKSSTTTHSFQNK